jgi:hypothetical protein
MQGTAVRREADTFRFQVSKALPLHLLVAWFEQAAPGDRIEYCSGYVELRDDAAWKLAGTWAREGLVHLVTERAGAVRHWIAERRGSCGPNSAVPDAKAAKVEHIAQIQMRELLKLLRDAAAAGLPCPSGTALAKAVTGQSDVRALKRVWYLRKRLVIEGKIAVAAGTHQRKPVVTILARGKGCGMSTAASEGEG